MFEQKRDESVKKGDSVAMPHTSSSELAAISIQARLPEFWPEMPRLWFAQIESILGAQKQSDEANFNIVVAKLGRDAIQQISDILLTPPETGKYKAVKERLLQAYEESAERQFQKLVSELELGSQRPTQLLRRMRELSRTTQVAEQTLKSLWMSRMPPSVRAVLAVCPEQGLDNLAAIADKVVENSRPYEVAAVSNTAEQGSVAAFTELAGQMNRLMLEVASLRNEVTNNDIAFNKMALRLKKDIKKASYYVWFLGAQESRGLRGEEFALPAIRILEERARDLEPFKVTLQVSHKGLKIIQNVTSKGKQQTIKHFIPHGSITSAVVQGDVVACVLLLYNPITGCPVHVHAYRCDSDHTAEMLYTHLLALIERPENQKKFAEIERKLQMRGALPTGKKPPDSSLGSEVSRESDSGSNEDRNVANLYDSLAAELKQKLSTGKKGLGKSPILLPPRDYDTVHRQKGNLSNIDTRRCLNQSIVGVNARRKLESSGGSSGIGSDLAPSPERNDYRPHDNHSTSEEDWAESTAYMMHEAFDASPPRRAPSPRRASPPRRTSPHRRTSPSRRTSPTRRTSPPRRTSPSRRISPTRHSSPPRRALSPRNYDRTPAYNDDLSEQFRDQLAPFREATFERRFRHESLERINKEKIEKYSEETPNYRRRYVADTKPSNRSIDRVDGRFGKLQRGASEGSLKLADASPKERFNVAKEKFKNLERERFNRELEAHMAIRRSMLEARNSRSTSSPEEERRDERQERHRDVNSRREQERSHRDVERSHREPERRKEDRVRDLAPTDLHREMERLPRVGRKRDDVKRYEYGTEDYLNRIEPKPLRDDYDRYRERRELDRRVDEDEIIEPVIDERRRDWNDRQRGFSRSRLLDEQRQSYAEGDRDRFYERDYRDFRDLADRQPTKFRHSYAEPISRGRLGTVRPY